MWKRAAFFCFVLPFWASLVFGQANGKLQIHFVDVGQGDGAVLISPRGETVLFDDGTMGNCDKPISYLWRLGLTKIDYHIASHYHSDHIGCAVDVLRNFPLQKEAIDRGGSYRSSVYENYISVVGKLRKTAESEMTITLDSDSPHPVVIKIVSLNGNGIKTNNENDLSVVAVIHFGLFDAEIGGDLSGFNSGSYADIETSVAELVGQVEVYKVHHHASRYSTNVAWLSIVRPKIAIVSVGDGNSYGHPTEECLERLHNAGIKTYWTEKGNGADPDSALDNVGGNIVVQVEPGSKEFSVRHSGDRSETYLVWESKVETEASNSDTPFTYAWSKKSNAFHYANCSDVAKISPKNLERGTMPPKGKTLHQNCPK